jgi:hypothetical protein
MATSTNKTTARKPAARKTAAAGSAAATTTSTQPKTVVAQVTEFAERVVLVPVGATLIVRDDVVSTVKGLTTKYRTRAGIERELKRFERRGVTARNRFERQVKRNRTRVEREIRQRRKSFEKAIKTNRRRVEREVKSLRKDLAPSQISNQVEKLVNGVQERLSTTTSS